MHYSFANYQFESPNFGFHILGRQAKNLQDFSPIIIQWDTKNSGGVILRVKYCSCKRRDVGITRAFRHFLKRIVFFPR